MQKCLVCGTKKSIIKHHTNYEKEKTVPLCRSCHIKIHKLKNSLLTPIDSHNRKDYTKEMKTIKITKKLYNYLMKKYRGTDKNITNTIIKLMGENDLEESKEFLRLANSTRKARIKKTQGKRVGSRKKRFSRRSKNNPTPVAPLFSLDNDNDYDEDIDLFDEDDFLKPKVGKGKGGKKA